MGSTINQELAIRKAEIKVSKAKLDRDTLLHLTDTGKDVLITLISNPVVTYIGGMMLISALGTLEFKYQKDGQTYRAHYLPSNEVFAMGLALSTALGVGALGGSSGIANIIKALK